MDNDNYNIHDRLDAPIFDILLRIKQKYISLINSREDPSIEMKTKYENVICMADDRIEYFINQRIATSPINIPEIKKWSKYKRTTRIDQKHLDLLKKTLPWGIHAEDKDSEKKTTNYDYPKILLQIRSVDMLNRIKEITNPNYKGSYKNLPLTYNRAVILLKNLENSDYKLSESEKEIRNHKSFKAQRTKYFNKTKKKEKFKDALDMLLNSQDKRLPVSIFLDIIGSPSKYYSDILIRSFIQACNNSNGEFRDRCGVYKVKKRDWMRNTETGKNEPHMCLI